MIFMIKHLLRNKGLNYSFNDIQELKLQSTSLLVLSLEAFIVIDYTMLRWLHVCGLLKRNVGFFGCNLNRSSSQTLHKQDQKGFGIVRLVLYGV
jgi:hypothetical protein